MKHLEYNRIGVDQGEHVVFSDFRNGGDMWTGQGPRERRQRVRFSERYREPPAVHCALSMWDVDSSCNMRADVAAEGLSEEGFDLVFRTWGDSRVARARIRWLSIGALRNPDDWEV